MWLLALAWAVAGDADLALVSLEDEDGNPLWRDGEAAEPHRCTTVPAEQAELAWEGPERMVTESACGSCSSRQVITENI